MVQVMHAFVHEAGVSIGTPTSAFQPPRKRGKALCFMWLTSWMKLSARYSASADTTAASTTQPVPCTVTATASAP